jgi:hypothetical protein
LLAAATGASSCCSSCWLLADANEAAASGCTAGIDESKSSCIDGVTCRWLSRRPRVPPWSNLALVLRKSGSTESTVSAPAFMSSASTLLSSVAAPAWRPSLRPRLTIFLTLAIGLPSSSNCCASPSPSSPSPPAPSPPLPLPRAPPSLSSSSASLSASASARVRPPSILNVSECTASTR